MKTSELIGPALDWAVESCEPEYNYTDWLHNYKTGFRAMYSSVWSLGGPIIHREGIGTFLYNKLDPKEPDLWGAHKMVQKPDWRGDPMNVALCLDGPTPLIAAMRCYVTKERGDEIKLPKELQ